MSLQEEITEETARLGFAAVGFAEVGESETFGIFQKWIAEGKCANMEYLVRHGEIRRDPRNLADGAKTAIVVAARYPINKQPGAGFSSYARGEDYHIVIRKKLRLLAEFIGRRTKLTTARICVDSAPLLEREWAVRAGIGWRGRQGQIVSPQAGCCVVIGELFVDIELPCSSQIPNQCGECRKCLDACPTGALQLDGTVDAAKCISYLTIEYKGEFTPEQAQRVGEALFGCDICTAVCPWNRQGVQIEDATSLLQQAVMDELNGGTMPTADECLTMTDEQFGERFKESSVLRLGLERLKRNAAAVTRNRRQSPKPA